MNRLTSVTDLTGAVTSYTYDANGNRSTMTYANGVTTSYTYDSCNRLIAETITDSAGTIIESYAITLGAAGERIQIVETNRTVTYTYDALYRLTQETITTTDTTSVTSYTYDTMSNRLTKTTDGVITTYTYNALNQLISENDITYSYDTNGNQVSQDGAAKSADYSYDPEGRLIRAVVTTAGTTVTETYQYNWNGIRIAKITDGVETKYLIDPNSSLSQVLAELDSAGNLVTYYTRGAELISLHRTGETRYYLYDPNSSVRILTNETGMVTDTYTYDAFGNLLAKTGMTVNNYLYTGEQYDANTGFYYLRARYMSPSTGTFISMDPFAGSIFDPISLHKYLYANANPIMNRDPSGRMTLLGQIAAMTIQEKLLAASLVTVTVGVAIIAGLLQNGIAPINMQAIVDDLCEQGIIGDVSSNTLDALRDAILASINAQLADWVRQDSSTKSKAGDKGGESSSLESESEETADPPLGSNGTKTGSTNVGKGPQGRVDVENPNPGQRPGQIHFQPNNSGDKWYYDIVKKIFYDPKTKFAAPPCIQKLLKEPWVQAAIDKGIYYLTTGT
jgi:RHS repeat-associated protein